MHSEVWTVNVGLTTFPMSLRTYFSFFLFLMSTMSKVSEQTFEKWNRENGINYLSSEFNWWKRKQAIYDSSFNTWCLSQHRLNNKQTRWHFHTSSHAMFLSTLVAFHWGTWQMKKCNFAVKPFHIKHKLQKVSTMYTRRLWLWQST